MLYWPPGKNSTENPAGIRLTVQLELHLDCTHPFQSCMSIDNEINNNIRQDNKDGHNISIQLKFTLPQDTMDCIKQTETCRKMLKLTPLRLRPILFSLKIKFISSPLECDCPGINERNILKKTTVSNFTQTFTINKPPNEYSCTQTIY